MEAPWRVLFFKLVLSRRHLRSLRERGRPARDLMKIIAFLLKVYKAHLDGEEIRHAYIRCGRQRDRPLDPIRLTESLSRVGKRLFDVNFDVVTFNLLYSAIVYLPTQPRYVARLKGRVC